MTTGNIDAKTRRQMPAALSASSFGDARAGRGLGKVRELLPHRLRLVRRQHRRELIRQLLREQALGLFRADRLPQPTRRMTGRQA
jgi:hypothetical protein